MPGGRRAGCGLADGGGRRGARRGILLNVNEPEVRGVTLAMQTVLDDLGKGLGPLVVAFMISAWGRCAPGGPAPA